MSKQNSTPALRGIWADVNEADVAMEMARFTNLYEIPGGEAIARLKVRIRDLEEENRLLRDELELLRGLPQSGKS